MTNAKTPISCDGFAETLADFLERDVAETTRAAMEAHALSCDDCGPLLADLRKLRIDAANLPELVPSRDLWGGIAERIETPVVAIGRPTSNERRARSYRGVWMGLAAAGLIAVTATVTHQLTKRANVASPSAGVLPTPVKTVATARVIDSAAAPPAVKVPAVQRSTTPASAPAPATAQLVANTRLSPEQTYDVEIAKLRKIVNARRADLDSSTVVVLENNLHIIDQAIANCKAALEKDPASRYLNESLAGALDSKVQLLRAAASLPTKM